MEWFKKLQAIPLLKPIFGFGKDAPPAIVGLPEKEMDFTAGPSEAWQHFHKMMELASDRLEIYKEFETMDSDDMILSALDLYAEEVTNTEITKGKIIWVESKNQDIKTILGDLLVTLDADNEAFSIAR